MDFAYAIHTDVGHRTIGAKVSGKLVPLDYELRTGDTVEILASRAQGEGPSQDWLQFVKTPRARSKIRQWFSRGRREDALEHGRDAVTRLMRKQNLPIKRLATTESLAHRRAGAEVREPRGALRRRRRGPCLAAVDRGACLAPRGPATPMKT